MPRLNFIWTKANSAALLKTLLNILIDIFLIKISL